MVFSWAVSVSELCCLSGTEPLEEARRCVRVSFNTPCIYQRTASTLLEVLNEGFFHPHTSPFSLLCFLFSFIITAQENVISLFFCLRALVLLLLSPLPVLQPSFTLCCQWKQTDGTKAWLTEAAEGPVPFPFAPDNSRHSSPVWTFPCGLTSSSLWLSLFLDRSNIALMMEKHIVIVWCQTRHIVSVP